jgi:AcrR family transcriptional regulator
MSPMQQHTDRGEAQKGRLVDVAYDLIADAGFEGLRTRDVASGAGVNISTLHYYFPSKEDLVRAVAQKLLREFREMPEARRDKRGPLELFADEVADQARLIRNHPATHRVVMEIFTRSIRDRSMRPIIKELLAMWENHIRSWVGAGIDTGGLVEGSDADTTARVLHCVLLGLVMNMQMDPRGYPSEDLVAQLDRWLRPHRKNSGS